MGGRAYLLSALAVSLCLAHVAPTLAKGGAGGAGHAGFHGRVASHGAFMKRGFSISRRNFSHGFNANQRFFPNQASAVWWPYWPSFGSYVGQAAEAPVAGETIVIANPSPAAPVHPAPQLVSDVSSVSSCHAFPGGYGYHCDTTSTGTPQQSQ